MFRAEDVGNYGTGGYYGNTYHGGINDATYPRIRFRGERDSYRHLGDRRQDNTEHSWEREQSLRHGYRSLEHRAATSQRGKGPRSYRRPDHRILEDLNDMLLDDPFLDATDIETSVQSGEVILEGTVEDRLSKRRAGHLAECVRGVTNIENRLKVVQR
jgi:osmotically-inducible protein OsmY